MRTLILSLLTLISLSGNITYSASAKATVAVSKATTTAASSSSATAASAASSNGEDVKSIYGYDTRIDYYQMTPYWQAKSDSTLALILSYKISKSGNQAFITTTDFGVSNNLCRDQAFYTQKKAAYCSGSLVGPDLVLTAGHCIENEIDCSTTSFVFDFRMDSPNSIAETVPISSVYNCARIVTRNFTSTNDYALIQLDRKVTDRNYLPVASTGYYLPEGTKLAVLGHPSGIPVKYAEGSVLDDSPVYYFQANLDTFAGNSGSSVFNRNTGEIEGILVRGLEDYKQNSSRGCSEVSIYPLAPNESEEVTRVNQVASSIRSYNSNYSPAVQCSINSSSQDVSIGQNYSVNWSVSGSLPSSSKTTFYSYRNSILEINEYIGATGSQIFSHGNTSNLDQTLTRGILVVDRLGNQLCKAETVVKETATVASCTLTANNVVSTSIAKGQPLEVRWDAPTVGLTATWGGTNNGNAINADPVANFGTKLWALTNPGGIAGRYTRWIDVKNSTGGLVCRTNAVEVTMLDEEPTCRLSVDSGVFEVGKTNQISLSYTGINPTQVKVLWTGSKNGQEDWSRVDLGIGSNSGFSYTNNGQIPGTYSRFVEVFDSAGHLICKSNEVRVEIK